MLDELGLSRVVYVIVDGVYLQGCVSITPAEHDISSLDKHRMLNTPRYRTLASDTLPELQVHL